MTVVQLEDVTATAATLAAIYRVPVGTIYRWASLDGWHRTMYAYPVRYTWADAERSYRQHRAIA